MCADQKVPSIGTKVDLVKKLAEKLEIEEPDRSTFDGDLSTIQFKKSLYICQEEFIHRERAVGVRGNPSLSSHRPRRNAGNCGEKRNLSEVELPFGISEENLQDIFETIERYIEHITWQKSKEQVSTQRDVICLPGNRILIYWGDEELGASNRKAGWFPAKVMKYEEYKDDITVKYVNEKDKEYKINVDNAMKRKIIKSTRTTLSESSIYDKVREASTVQLKRVRSTGEEISFKKIKLRDEEGDIQVCLWRNLASTNIQTGDIVHLSNFIVTDTFNNMNQPVPAISNKFGSATVEVSDHLLSQSIELNVLITFKNPI
ncbi:unnamed protein product [Mytilus edulis]|uniref:Uncharacterized protein n=1 Tax=Mytilus edulis TaxID=6550 RepID=A0A8S3Q389_MYTED|nr:unnamed protein product [Mytilus edulis]